MKIKPLKKNRNLFLKYVICAFLLSSFVFVSEYALLQRTTLLSRRDEIMRNEEKIISLQSISLRDQFKSVLDDIRIMTNIRDRNELELNYDELERNWTVYLETRDIYDEITLLDLEGNEMLVIKNTSEGVYRLDRSENRSEQESFKNGLALEPGQIHISNIHFKDREAPVVEFTKMLYSSEYEPVGIVVLSYTGENILSRFQLIASTSRGSFYLVNSDGYWVSKVEAEYESNTAEAVEESNDFKELYPKVWNRMTSSKRGRIYDSEKGVFIFGRSDELLTEREDDETIYSGENFWHIVSFIPKESEEGYLLSEDWKKIIAYSLWDKVWIFFLLFLFSIAVSTLILMNRLSKEKIKFFSEYDEMTETLNRRAGISMLTDSFNEIGENDTLSICFLDVNGLKEVNDTFGHDKGDELIITLSEVIKKFIRKSDFIVRLGGDEFLMVFPATDEAQAEKIWERINEECWRINESSDRKYRIIASHGISSAKKNEYSDLDEFIRIADEKMYQEKRELKQKYNTIK